MQFLALLIPFMIFTQFNRKFRLSNLCELSFEPFNAPLFRSTYTLSSISRQQQHQRVEGHIHEKPVLSSKLIHILSVEQFSSHHQTSQNSSTFKFHLFCLISTLPFHFLLVCHFLPFARKPPTSFFHLLKSKITKTYKHGCSEAQSSHSQWAFHDQ